MSETELFAQAIAFAATKHANQKRKDGTPFVYHLMEVAELVKNAGYHLEYQITAVLHDVLEDTDASEEDIAVYGKHVVEAVKLLTRQEGMDEEEYVDRILTNHMASVVKNASKINNLWNIAFYGEIGRQRSKEDKTECKEYIANSRRYYKDKFSYALKNAISKADAFLNYANYQEKKYPKYSRKEMSLYSDREKLAYTEMKEKYDSCKIKPDLLNPQMAYYSVDGTIFCVLNGAGFSARDTWVLTQAGWLPREEGLVASYEYDLFNETRETVIEKINRKIEKGYFYDFVDLSLL